MALIGISLILASVVYVAIRRPPLIETLLALWRGDPKIEQPPTTRRPPPPSPSQGDGRNPPASSDDAAPPAVEGVESSRREGATDNDRAAMPPPPPPPVIVGGDNGGEESPQTTPKASATHLTDSGVPTFTLSPEPPASPAAVERKRSSSITASPPSLAATAAGSPSASPPSLLGAPRLPAPPVTNLAPAPSASTLMPPPPPPSAPRPPTLNPTSSSSSSRLAPAPSRGATQAQMARQPGTSTLAPPPTHNSKPSKPSRKVTLEPGCSPLDWARLAATGPSAELRGLPAGTPYLRVSPSQLKARNGRRGNDAWTALGGRVYNITPYVRFHPGGGPELLRGAGRDGTRLFGEVHPWVNYETMLASCLVGVLVAEGEETPPPPPPEAGHGAMDEMD